MRVIDANTGLTLKKGMRFKNVMGTVDVLGIKPGILAASILLSVNGLPPRWSALQVRWLHPSFPLQHVAFLPS